MKKVILNGVIKDLDGNVVKTISGRVLNEDTGVWEDAYSPITFGSIAYQVLIGSRTKTDEDARALFSLAEKLNANLKETATEMELTESEFDIVNKSISGQALIVKVRFLEMVEELNPTASEAAE